MIARSFRSRRRQLGASLLEILLILGVASAIVVALFVTYTTYHNTARANIDVDDVRSLLRSGTSYYQNQSSYLGISMALLNNANALPNRIQSQGSYTNVWGGLFSLSSASSPSGNNDIIVLTSTGLPIAACERLTAVLGPEMYDTAVNGSIVPLTPAADANGWERYNTAQNRSTKLCASSNNTLVFRQLKPPTMWAYRTPPYSDAMLPAEAVLVNAEATRYQNALTAREAVQNSLP